MTEFFNFFNKFDELDIIMVLLFCPIWIMGFHAVTREGFLLSFLALRNKHENKVNELTDSLYDLLALDIDDDKTISELKTEIEKEKEKAIRRDKNPIWKALKMFSKPWSECRLCMSSLHSLLWISFSLAGFFSYGIFWIFVIPIMVAGLICFYSQFGNNV